MTEEIANCGYGIEKEMVIIVIQSFKEILDDLFDMLNEFLSMEGDVAN
jgi:hypothetical protein